MELGQKFVYKENMFLIFVEKLSIVKIICKGCDRMEHLKPIFFFSLVILFMILLLYLVHINEIYKVSKCVSVIREGIFTAISIAVVVISMIL